MRFVASFRKAFVYAYMFAAIACSSSSSLAKSVSQLPVNHATTTTKVVVWATANISKGSKIVDSDLQERVIDSTGGPSDSVGCRLQVVGRIAKYAIENGEIVLQSELEEIDRKAGNHNNFSTNCKGASFVVTRRVIQPGAKIKSDDLETRWISAMKANPRWLPRADMVVGLRSNALVQKGKVLTFDFARSLSGTTKSN